MDHIAMHIGEAEVSAAVTVRQLRMVDPHQMQDGGVQIVNVRAILDCGESKLVSRSICHPPLHTTARHPDGEAVIIVVASVGTF